MKSEILRKGKNIIFLNDLPSGIYQTIIEVNGQKAVYKIIKN